MVRLLAAFFVALAAVFFAVVPSDALGISPPAGPVALPLEAVFFGAGRVGLSAVAGPGVATASSTGAAEAPVGATGISAVRVSAAGSALVRLALVSAVRFGTSGGSAAASRAGSASRIPSAS
ncbi:MAG: hypothetical protein M3N32_04080, partial [Actinomycetota bacterium]|nr:hypothetical protein [Actinomycetota bacterium]